MTIHAFPRPGPELSKHIPHFYFFSFVFFLSLLLHLHSRPLFLISGFFFPTGRFSYLFFFTHYLSSIYSTKWSPLESHTRSFKFRDSVSSVSNLEDFLMNNPSYNLSVSFSSTRFAICANLLELSLDWNARTARNKAFDHRQRCHRPVISLLWFSLQDYMWPFERYLDVAWFVLMSDKCDSVSTLDRLEPPCDTPLSACALCWNYRENYNALQLGWLLVLTDSTFYRCWEEVEKNVGFAKC